MINSWFQSTTLPALEQTSMFAQRRHELLASNVANMDTPGYRARDLSQTEFEVELAGAIERQFAPAGSHLKSPGAMSTDPFDGPKRAMHKLVYHDDTDVNLERQVTELSKNQSLHSMAIALMRSQFSVLQAAITERA